MTDSCCARSVRAIAATLMDGGVGWVGAGPLPHPATQYDYPMGGRVGEWVDAAFESGSQRRWRTSLIPIDSPASAIASLTIRTSTRATRSSCRKDRKSVV